MLNVPNYKIERILGEGRFSTVYEASHKKSGDRVALKSTCKILSGFIEPSFINNELEAFKIVNHRNIVKFIEFLEDEDNGYFILEYINGYTLQRVIFETYKRPDEIPLPMKTVKSYLLQLLEGLKYLHSKNIYHCDLKPENIVIENDHLKIIDFGCSIISKIPVNAKKLMYWGTAGYSPPETQDPDYMVKLENVDIWAFTCNFFYIFKNFPPFQDTSLYNTLQNVKNISYDSNLPPYPKFLIQSVFIENPDLRINLEDLEILINGLKETGYLTDIKSIL